MIDAQDIDVLGAIDWLNTHTTFPTFDEFRRNPDKYRNRPDDLLVSAEGSTQAFKKNLIKQKYMWMDQYEAKSLEMIERIAKEEGFSPDQLEMQPLVRSTTGMSGESVEIVIHFWPKEIFKARGGVIANE